MNAHLTKSEAFETALRDVAVLVGVNNLPRPFMLTFLDGKEGLLVSALFRDEQVSINETIPGSGLAALKKWADAADMPVRREPDEWFNVGPEQYGAARLQMSAHDRAGAL